MSRCATCTYDPIVATWHNPTNAKVRGVASSNWICNSCRNLKSNRHWTCTPSAEVYGLENEAFEAAQSEIESEQGQYETRLCIEIMRRYCLREPQRSIAKNVATPLSYVVATVRYWKIHRSYFLSKVMDVLSEDA